MEKLLRFVYENRKIRIVLKVISCVCILASVAGFAGLLLISAALSLMSLLKVVLTLGIPFAMVTLSRALIDAKRPYELYDFYKIKPKKKKGRSFPSRHAYSSFAIATAMMFAYPILGGVLFFFSILLSVCRVLLGIHFIRDVTCGGIIGIISGIIGMLVLSPF